MKLRQAKKILTKEANLKHFYRKKTFDTAIRIVDNKTYWSMLRLLLSNLSAK